MVADPREIPIDFNVFPNNAVQVITAALEGVHPAFAEQAFPRQLRPTDPDPAIGVFPSLWVGQEDSQEMGRNQNAEPTLATYSIIVQAINKDSDKDIALARHATIARMVRNTLYRDNWLRLQLAGLQVTDGIVQERFQRRTIGTQRFMSNEIGSQFVFLSVLDLSIETETR